jgi:hypothetical protein
MLRNYPINSCLEKIMGKSCAYHKRCAEKLSSDSYAKKYHRKKLYTYINYNFLNIESGGERNFPGKENCMLSDIERS